MLACSIEPHGHDVFGTHTLIGHARRRDQKPLAPTHRYVAGSALIYAEGVHLPARLDNRSADRDFIVSNHPALLSGTRGGPIFLNSGNGSIGASAQRESGGAAVTL